MEGYTAWLNWTITNRCNFRCEYCIQGESRIKEPIDYNDVATVNNIIENLNKQEQTFCINITGGEPFLIPNIVEIMQGITNKHYISINSNLTSPKIREVAEKISPDRIHTFNASLHIDELEKHALVEKYISNFLMLKDRGINVYASLVGHPMYIPKLEKYTELLELQGIHINIVPFCGSYNSKNYPEAYTEEELDILKLNKVESEGTFRCFRKDKPCNAGFNIAAIRDDGEITPCYSVISSIGNIFSIFKFNDFILSCPTEVCYCPFPIFHEDLFKSALDKSNGIHRDFNPISKGCGREILYIIH